MKRGRKNYRKLRTVLAGNEEKTTNNTLTAYRAREWHFKEHNNMI
jgi:hypothetical protein